MSRIDSIFAQRRGRPALMPFVTAGFPSLEATERLLPRLEEAGASAVELGFPFSDPIADGPVIAASMHEALAAGVTPRAIFEMVARARPRTKLGLIAMVSDSIITRMGPEAFIDRAAKAGIDGLIVPDIDIDAAVPLSGLAKMRGLSFTLLVAPTTIEDRMAKIASLCTGFIYLLARVGITGESAAMDLEGTRSRIAMLRRHADLPIAVGFGISTAEHVKQVGSIADAAIVGSALVRRMKESPDPVAAAESFVRQLAGSL